MNKFGSFLSFFLVTVLSVSGGIGIASVSYSGFNERLTELSMNKKDTKINIEGRVAGVSTSQIIPAGEEYAMLVTVASAATKPICTSLMVDASSGVAPFDVKFTGSGQGDSLSYKFVFGDGEQVTTLDAQTVHTYIKPGTYTATLNVISNKSESDNVDACKVLVAVTEKAVEQQVVAPVVSEVSHLVCRNLACVRVAGEGENECSTNLDCSNSVPVTEVQAETSVQTEAKPLVPVTGGSQLAFYLVLALGFISAGLIILIFL